MFTLYGPAGMFGVCQSDSGALKTVCRVTSEVEFLSKVCLVLIARGVGVIRSPTKELLMRKMEGRVD